MGTLCFYTCIMNAHYRHIVLTVGDNYDDNISDNAVKQWRSLTQDHTGTGLGVISLGSSIKIYKSA